MENDIVERLISHSDAKDVDAWMTCKEAADLITALRVENGRLRRALEFYAAWPQSPSGNMAALLVDAGHKARAALEEKQ